MIFIYLQSVLQNIPECNVTVTNNYAILEIIYSLYPQHT